MQVKHAVGERSGGLTFWNWLCLVLLFCLAGFVVHQWLLFLRTGRYPAYYLVPMNTHLYRAHLARIGMAVMLSLTVGIYLKKSSRMAWMARGLFVAAIGLAVAVLVIFWTTRFRYW